MSDTEGQVSYKASEMHEDVEKEIERLRDQALWSWDKESRNMAWFGLRDGMSILEVGSGPGFITEQLLAAHPNSHVTCVEIDPDLIQRAERYLQSRGMEGRYTIIQGDLMKMDLADDTFDFALARLVFQHLPDPLGAMREIHRVLKPGGRLTITDVEGGLRWVIDPPDSPEVEAIIEKMEKAQESRGGNRNIGRKLWRLLGAAGFVNMDLEIIPIHSDKLGIEAIMPSEWDPGAFKPALDRGIITEEEVEIMHKAHMEFHASPDKYALFVALMACGEKAA